MTGASSAGMPRALRSALRFGWILVSVNVAARMWPYWRAAAHALPADTNGLAWLVALLIASMVLLFTPVLVGQLTWAVCLVLLARRQGWARWLFLVGAVVSTMATLIAAVGKVGLVTMASFYMQLVFVVLGILFVVHLFRKDADDWFRSRLPLRIGRAP